MVKNLIFDFGQVLVHFDPDYMTGCYVEDKEDARLLKQVIFDRLYWDRLDKGTITDQEVLRQVKTRIPQRLHKAAEQIYNNWYYNIPEMEGMRELLSKMRAEYNVKTYILSDISRGFAEHAEEIEILHGFDGFCFSAVEGFCKPDPKAMENLLNKFALSAEESFFVDDKPANIEGALKAGVNGFVFEGDATALEKKLIEIL